MGFRPFSVFGVAFGGTVSGTLSPDASGDYHATGWLAGREYWVGGVVSHYIYWDPVGENWNISVILGDQGTAHWYRDDPSPYGLYVAGGTATGEATFAAS